MRYIKTVIIILIIIFTISCTNTNKTEKDILSVKERTTGYEYNNSLHTFIKFTAYTETQKEFDDYVKLIDEVILIYAPMVSIYQDGGEANIINTKAFKEKIPISDDLYKLVNRCLFYSKLTEGAFDITIKPVFDLWDFEGNQNKLIIDSNIKIEAPSKESIKEKLQYVNYKYIELNEEKKISFKKEGVEILLGGVAKGFILEKIHQILIDEGIKSGLFEAGGDIIIFDKKPDGTKWNIGVKSPRIDDEKMPVVKGYDKLIYGMSLSNSSIVTSGDYEQFYIDANGVIQHHIIDPKTGYPAKPVISATVISKSILDSDILSTAILVMGKVKGMELIEKLPDTEASMVYISDDGDYEIIDSSGFSDYVVISYKDK